MTCVHCESKVLRKRNFCATCQSHFEFLDPKQQCPFCFCESNGVCSSCLENKRFGIKLAAACEHAGAITTFISLVRKGIYSKLASSLLSVQFFRLKWDIPDLIIPLPSRGNFGYIKLFAKAIGVPYCTILKKSKYTLPQMRLPWKERESLTKSDYYLCGSVEGKSILLVDDLFATGATLRAAAGALQGASRINALTLSRLSFL